jgi:hypothetical protein
LKTPFEKRSIDPVVASQVRRSESMAKERGEELAEAVKLVLDHSTWMSSLAGSLCAAFTETTIHFSGPTDRASCERLLESIVVNASRDVVKKVRQK